MNHPVAALRVALAGQVDLAWTSGNPPIVARAKEAPIRLIYSAAPRLDTVLTVQGDIKDLKGRKMGIQEPVGLADIFSRRTLVKGLEADRGPVHLNLDRRPRPRARDRSGGH